MLTERVRIDYIMISHSTTQIFVFPTFEIEFEDDKYYDSTKIQLATRE